jgi:hypothetical protein
MDDEIVWHYAVGAMPPSAARPLAQRLSPIDDQFRDRERLRKLGQGRSQRSLT